MGSVAVGSVAEGPAVGVDGVVVVPAEEDCVVGVGVGVGGAAVLPGGDVVGFGSVWGMLQPGMMQPSSRAVRAAPPIVGEWGAMISADSRSPLTSPAAMTG